MATKPTKYPVPPSAISFRRHMQDPIYAKTCYFYQAGNYKASGIKMAVHPRRHRRLEALYSDLSNKMKELPYGVRSIYTPGGHNVIRHVDGLQDDGHYICATRKYGCSISPMDVNRVLPPRRWNLKKPPSGQRDLNSILHDPDLDDMPRVKRARYQREQMMAYAYNRSHPKKVTVLKNGEPSQRHILLINRRTAQSFDQILNDLSEMFGSTVSRLYTMDGKKMMSLTQLFNGPEVIVAAGKEKFIPLLDPLPPSQSHTRQNTRSRIGANEFAADKLKSRRDRLLRTKGQWKVWVTTNELSTAGTTAQVTLTVYGHKGQSLPLPLGFGDGKHFQSGHIDEFDVSVGSIGEIYKIRISHDNSGDSPSWFCDEVRMRDKDSGEELVFSLKRWMSRDEDDKEICREAPANRRGDPHLPVLKYEVTVLTGNLWNGGTDANVYLTLYGDRGDTGVRHLYCPRKDQIFNKGQTDHFTVESVSLGKLKRVIVGHDGTNAGEGWFLEKIVVQEPDAKPHDVYNFHCNRWLDEGEDDGKIVREIKVQDEYTDDILAKRNRLGIKRTRFMIPKGPKFNYKSAKQWELEKWKFENKNQVIFFSLVTGKALRMKADGTVDGLGEKSEPGSVFLVSSKKPMVRIFTSLLNASYHLAIDNGKIVGHGRGGPYCEFRIHVQSDCSVMLEGVKSPLQFISLLESGKLGDPRGILDREPGKRFLVYCKGMFRHRGNIMLKTSNTQAITAEHDFSLFGTGKCTRAAHFRVHKVESGGIRMFESMVHPGRYLRLFDGKIDCQGTREEKSHWVVTKHKDKGYVTIQSKSQRGIFIGLTPAGEVRPTVDTGVNNNWLFPEVVEFGVSKKNFADDKLTPISEQDTINTQRSPEPKALTEVSDGDWKVTLETLENLEHGQVALVVYGDKGHSGPIMLTPPVKNGHAFRAGSSDEFKANLLKVGQVYKVRLELVQQGSGRTPTWKVGSLKMLDLNLKNELMFRFDRYLSRRHDDCEIMRELPVFKNGKEILPMRQYEVRVYTGKEESADTRAEVYINLYGEHGDCGKRVLLKSNNPKPFQMGQVDIFQLEAVSLGELMQCQVGHDGTKSGDGWYLDSIVVRESKNAPRQFVFPCNRWLDSGREDRKIERMLQVKETSDSKPPLAQTAKNTPVLITAEPLKTVSFTVDSDPVPVASESPDVVLSIPYAEEEANEELEKSVSEEIPVVAEQPAEDDTVKTEEEENDYTDIQTEEEEVQEEAKTEVEEMPIEEEEAKTEIEEIQEEEKDEEAVSEEIAEAADVTEDEDVTFPTESDDENIAELLPEDKEEEQKAEEVPEEEEKNEDSVEEITFGETDEDDDVPVETVTKEPTPPPPAEEKPEDGTWRLLLTTGQQEDMGCIDSVVLYAYGNLGCVGPILIGHGGDGVFQRGSTDEFKVIIQPEKTGKLYKVRLCLTEKTPGAQWFLEKMVMVDLVGGETLHFQVQRWLSRGHEDFEVCRELPVAHTGETPLPMCNYQVHVQTGDMEDADTEAEIYITLFGEMGDSGKRMLYKSKSSGKMFTKGKTDIFSLEAVSLGGLQHIVLGHNQPTPGQGWYLTAVTIYESDTPGSKEFYFPGNRWLDGGKEDEKTEVKLLCGDKPKESMGEFQMWVTTATDSSAANGGKVFISAYGSQGHIKDVELYAPNGKGHLFEPGNIDEFEVSLGKIGEIQKLRVQREDIPTWKAWHLDEIKMKDKATGETLVFAFNRWFSRDMEDHDLVRELPALKDNKPVSKVCQYEVITFTGDHWAAGTDATVHITLIGSKGDSGKRILHAPSGNIDIFRLNKEDTFELEAVDLGELTSMIIGHNGKGHGAGWFLDRVVVKTKTEGGRFFFPCMRWLDDGEDDGKTGRELQRIDMPELMHIAPMKDRDSSTSDWQLFVRTSDMDQAATCAQVYLTVYGSQGVSSPLPLGDGSPNSDTFWRGKESKFEVNIGRVGEIRKIRLEHDNRNPDPAWHVESVRMVDKVTEEELYFPVNRWLAEDKEDGQLHRECGVISPAASPVPVLRYVIAVQTGRQRSAGVSEGWISVNLVGHNGDTGQQLLQRPLSNATDKMTAGKLDVYMLEAVSVGTLQSLRLVFEGKGRAQKWFVERVMVLESVGALEETVFDFNCWLDASEDNAKEVPVSDVQISCTVTDDIAYRLLGRPQPESEGNWEVTVWTAKESDATTKDPVMLVLYGTTGHTEPKPLNKDHAFNAGSLVKLQVNTGLIGPLFKIRLMFADRSGNSSWTMDRLKLKDLDTGEEFHFDEGVKLESSPESPDGATELPAIRPDIAPLPEVTYQVRVTTGSQERAETDSEIFCTLIGQWGDSGERLLREAKSHKEPFGKGQTDEFELKTLLLGHVKKVLIGHNESGRGRGWFCQQVTVQALNSPAPEKKHDVVFSCNRWLDSGCDDRRLVRELIPAGEILPPNKPVDRTLSRGVWNCMVHMTKEDKLDASLTAISLPEQVSLVVYGTKGTQGPIPLQDPKRHELFLLGQTDKFENVILSDVGDIQKVRVSAGKEEDDNLVWVIEQVILEDTDSHEILSFDFRRWVGEVGGDIHRELPVMLPGQLPLAVLEYEVQVQTENTKDAGTNASVFINIYGKNGDTGPRRLIKSKSKKPPFQAGQTDVFTVEAVDLGDLEKVVVTKGPGQPWQLSQIKVRPGQFSALSHVFIWSNMVGNEADQSEDASITIPLISSWPAPVAIPAEQADDLPITGGKWSVEVVTGDKGVSGEGTDLVMVMCGDKGESAPISFHSRRENTFQPGQTDSSVIHLAQDVGDLIKLRLGFADNTKHKALHLAKLNFEDLDTHDTFSHVHPLHMEVNDADDGWTEFPVVWPAVHILPVIKYKVEVTTGSIPKGTTDAQVYIQLHGRMGSTGRRQLKKSNNDVMFQLGQMDVFEFEAVSLMSVDKVRIGHNDPTAGKGWFLKKVTVIPQGEEESEFECNRWLDGGEDDGRIERVLTQMDTAAPTPDIPRSDNKWQVWVTTGSSENQGTSCPMVVILYGDRGHSKPLMLGNGSDTLTEGQTQQFEVETETDVGAVYKIRVGFDGEGREPYWYSDISESPALYLDRVKVQEESSGKQYEFEARQWVRVDEKHDHWKEFPAYTREEEDMLQSKEYYVEVFTGDRFGAGTDANVYLQIFGERGDTGKRHLHGTLIPGLMFEQRMHDAFTIDAVDLGQLHKVNISHDARGAGSGWFLDKITIKESRSSTEKYVFDCHKWLDVDEDDGAIERELPVSTVVSDSQEAPGDVTWQVRVMTSMVDPSSGTDSKVTMTVFGDKGITDPTPLMPDDGVFHPGQTDNFEVTLNGEKIGRIEKIRLQHDSSGQQPDWHVEKVVFSSNLGNEAIFTVNRWLSPNIGNNDFPGDTVCEAPAKWPGQQPLPRFKYFVKSVTSKDPASGTDASVHLNLVGSRGDSGFRELRQNLESRTKFQDGMTDSFVIEAVDLGTLKKVVVSLQNPGPRASWKPQCFLVRASDSETSVEKANYVFPWGKLLDEDNPTAEINLAEVVDDYTENELMGQTPRDDDALNTSRTPHLRQTPQGSAPHTPYNNGRNSEDMVEDLLPDSSREQEQTPIGRSPQASGRRTQTVEANGE